MTGRAIPGRVATHEWVVSPYHEVVICPCCGTERVERTSEPKPEVTIQIQGGFAGLPERLQPRGGHYA